ncbi:MAG: hypothetical protein HOW97_28925 [Catenulispora sp.]|nr:hypothetical protein [Catenulispora sp.]
MRRPKLACAAEAWGYGPASKLLSIARRVDGVRTAFVTGTARTFVGLNRPSFDGVQELRSPGEILDADLDADHLLNVMDPCAALAAARAGVPSTYVDSLSWFWRWDPEDYAELRREAGTLLRMSRADLADYLSGADWHRMVPMAYLWSDQVFVQRMGPPDRRLKVFGHHVEPCAAIVDVTAPAAGHRTVKGLVSLSGGLSHAAQPRHARTYAEFVRALFDQPETQAVLQGARCHPDMLETTTGRSGMTASQSHDELSGSLAGAPFILAPAGLTTALEAAAVRTPLGLLPEQHGGHRANAELLDAGRGIYPSVLVSERLGVTADDPSRFIEEISTSYRSILSSRPRDLSELRSAMSAMVSRLSDSSQAAELADRQHRRVIELTGGFDGAQSVADAVAEALGPVRGEPIHAASSAQSISDR